MPIHVVEDTALEGNIDAGGYKVINLGTATATGDAVNKTQFEVHTGNTSNPHSVTKAQVGLTNVSDDAQLKIASNLSDVNNVTTARANLGVEVYYAESTAQSSQSTTTPTSKVTLTFTPLIVGYFEIKFSALLSSSVKQKQIRARIYIDNATARCEWVDETGAYEYGDAIKPWIAYSGVFVSNFTVASHTIALQYYRGADPLTVYIKEATITARKIS